jgi:hypothetical protein
MRIMLSKIFGPNWRSSSSGIATVVAVTTAIAIHSDPTLIHFLPDIAQEYINGIARLVAVVSGIIFALTVKDAAVTGGSVAQTNEAKDRTNGENI